MTVEARHVVAAPADARSRLAGVPALLLAAALLVSGCGEKPGKGPAAPPVVKGVEVAAAAAAHVDRSVEAVGTVRAANIAAVAAQIMGRITAVLVSEGSRVARGDLIATIDDEAVRAQAAAAEGAVAEAESAAEEALRAIAQAEAERALAEKTYARFRALVEERVVTRQEFDEVEARRTVAVQGHERAIEKRAQAEARVRQAKANAEAARTMLSYAKVTAPFAGIVTEKRADAGSMAVPGAPIVVLEDTRRYRIEAAVPEAYLPLLKPGLPVEVLLDAFPGRTRAARVSEVVPLVDPGSRTFTVKAELSGPGLRTGLFGRLRFRTGTVSVLAVPERAVARIGGVDGLFVLTPDNVARLTVVRTGERFGDRVEILSGIEAGARIAVAPLDRLVDGARVEAGK